MNHNYYAACLRESCLLKYSIKFLLWLEIIDKTDLDNSAETATMDVKTEKVNDASFGGNTQLAYEMGLVSKSAKLSLDRFRKTRNRTIHEAFSSELLAKVLENLYLKVIE